MAASPLIPTHLRSSYKLSRSALTAPGFRWAVFAALLVAAALLFFTAYHFIVSRAARKEAMEFVQAPAGGGHISWGYRYLLFWKMTTTTACVAEGRMNDRMAAQLANIYDLDALIVYSPVPNVGRLDVPENHWTVNSSLRKLDLPMSEKSIAEIERRFPRLKVYVLKPVGVKS